MKKCLQLILMTIIITLPSVFADESFATLYPNNTALFFEFNNTDSTNSNFSETAFAKMLAEPQTQNFLAHTRKKLTEVMTFATMLTQGIKPDDILSALGNHVALGVYTKDNLPYAVLITEFPADIDPVKLTAPMNPAGPDAAEFKFSFPIDPDKMNFFVSVRITGQRLYAAFSPDMNILDSAGKAAGNSLENSSGYLRASSQLGKNRLITSFVNPELYNVVISTINSFAPNADISAINKDTFNTVAYGVRIEAPAFVQRLYMKSGFADDSAEIFSEPDPQHLTFVPDDSSSMVTAGVDLNRLYQYIIKTVTDNNVKLKGLTDQQRQEVQDEITGKINEVMSDFENETGINPLTDILANLDKEMTSYVQDSSDLPGLQLFGFSGYTTIINVKNKAKLEESLNKGLDQLVARLQDQAADKLEIKTDYGTIKGISLAGSLTVCYTFIENKLIFALNPAAIEHSFAVSKSDKNYAKSTRKQSFDKEMAKVAAETGISGTPVRTTFMSIDGISDVINNTVALGTTIGGLVYSTEKSEEIRNKNNGELPASVFPDPNSNPPAFLRYIAEAFPLYLLPSNNVINRHVFDAWETLYITAENEYVDINYGPFPIDSTLFSKDFGKLVKLGGYALMAAGVQQLFDADKGSMPQF